MTLFEQYLYKIIETQNIFNEDINYSKIDNSIVLSLDLVGRKRGEDTLESIETIEDLYKQIISFNGVTSFKLEDTNISSYDNFKNKLEELKNIKNITLNDLGPGLFLKIKSEAALERNKSLKDFFLNLKDISKKNYSILLGILKFINIDLSIPEVNETNIFGDKTFEKISLKLTPYLLEENKANHLKTIINSNATLSGNLKKQLTENIDEFRNIKGEVDAKFYTEPSVIVTGTPKTK